MTGAGWSGCRRMGSMKRYAAYIAPLRAALPAAPASRDLIRFATLAANSHNTQAWQFRVTPDRIDILPDLARRTPAVDPDDHHLFATLGCAARIEPLPVSAKMRAATVDDFGFEQTVDRLGHSIIATCTDESGAVQDRM